MTRRLHEYVSACRALFLAALVAVTACVALAPSTSEAAMTIPVNVPKFDGTFTLNSFTTQTINGANTLAAVGTLQGTVKDAKKGVVNAVAAVVVVPVTITGTCPILHLDLGPLNLDLLGLKIDLSEVVLDIAAVAGPGNLLGNLLCTVANLLNPGTLDELNQLVALLNQILDLLG